MTSKEYPMDPHSLDPEAERDGLIIGTRVVPFQGNGIDQLPQYLGVQAIREIEPGLLRRLISVGKIAVALRIGSDKLRSQGDERAFERGPCLHGASPDDVHGVLGGRRHGDAARHRRRSWAEFRGRHA